MLATTLAPSEGSIRIGCLDPVSRREFWGILDDVREEGMTVVVSTAYLEEGERCDELCLMHGSRVIGRGGPDLSHHPPRGSRGRGRAVRKAPGLI